MRQVRIAAREVARRSVAGDLDLANMKPEDRGDYLAGGVPATLSRTTDTTEARGLVGALWDSLEAHHLQSGRWKYQRGPAAQERPSYLGGRGLKHGADLTYADLTKRAPVLSGRARSETADRRA